MEIEENGSSLSRNSTRRRWSGQFSPAEILSDSSETDETDQNTERNDGVHPRRSLRKKIRTALPETHRVLTKSKKLSENSSLKDIENYYLDRNVRILNPSLETIFEEPQQVRNEEVTMSARKYRRSINFKATTAKNPAKIRKRKLKAKQVLANKRHKKVSLKFLMDKLAELSDD